jgi:hypothetical protein
MNSADIGCGLDLEQLGHLRIVHLPLIPHIIEEQPKRRFFWLK